MSEFKFEERICKHPKCKQKFKVLENSTQEFHSNECKNTYSETSRRAFLEGTGFLPAHRKLKDELP